ncbi:hypothetical protein SAMN04487943_104112 [Gracilibacillus orientalis]|uniref:Uncharacterized protein n=1 Tax=Gracilibacillus orientalis TaxID=334253 RepID=A0A1I4KR74_9BACI|nr:hypothetical protein [Gracilibacillus orientalis]SFL81302.1 hypothetical protein SAMN04487943_104112 [Gracilibacillus orientalis]
MSELLSFIVPIIAIVFWLFGLSKSKDEQQSPQRPQRPQRTDQQTTSNTQHPRTETTAQSVPNHQGMETNIDSGQETFAQQKKEQMEELNKKIHRSEKIRDKNQDQELGKHDAIKNGPTQKAYRKDNEKEISLSIEKNLTSKGIAQGIIMSEVLGPPRAYQKRKYYRNDR